MKKQIIYCLIAMTSILFSRENTPTLASSESSTLQHLPITQGEIVDTGRPGQLPDGMQNSSLNESPETGLAPILTVKEKGWVSTYKSGLAAFYSEFTDVVTDEAGFVYVAGHTQSAENGMNILLKKYDALGNLYWERQFDYENKDDYTLGIKLDPHGNICLVGTGYGVDTQEDFVVLQYDINGELLWAQTYNASLSGKNSDIPIAFTIDDAGNIYVTGNSRAADSKIGANTVSLRSNTTDLVN